ncbi:MAG TPA: hypothetical protein VHN78_02415 [Chloroflexota bacterium]|nr:hypothetical protein [Chloroflexota bacterium]
MTRQLAGAVFLAVAAILYAARHVGAMVLVANETGDLSEAYRAALRVGAELLTLSVIAPVVGLGYLLWGEYESRALGRASAALPRAAGAMAGAET